MKQPTSDAATCWIQWIACGVALAAFVFCIDKSLHWQIVWDQAVIRYARFLMSQGLRPYSDITDMNMPGSYLMEMGGITVFGWSDMSWRVYEYFLIAGLAASGALLGGRRYWMTGVLGATLFLLLRFAEGEAFSMERNEILSFLDLLGMALLFLAVRQRRPWLVGASCFLASLGAAMKPGGFLLDVILIILLIAALRRHGLSLRSYLWWGFSGTVAVGIIVLSFLVREKAVHGFCFIVYTVWPRFRTMSANKPMVFNLVPKALVPLTVLAGIAAHRNRIAMRWERSALLTGMIYGALSYLLEGDTAGYHRYVFLVFLTTWIGWETAVMLRQSDLVSRFLGVAAVCVMFGFTLPHYLQVINEVTLRHAELDAYPAALQKDLDRLGGNELQGQVECLEMVDGCLHTLYEMRLMQNTGSTGDLLLFAKDENAAVLYYRDWYMRKQMQNPASVVVVGNFSFQVKARSFERIETWPAYATVLRTEYVLFDERYFGTGNAPGYRIYLRKGSKVLQTAQESTL